MSRTISCSLLTAFLVFGACTGDQDECFTSADCIDGDRCTEDRCRYGRCSYSAIPGCCLDDGDCAGEAPRTRCRTEDNRCVECFDDQHCGGNLTCNLQSNLCESLDNPGAACVSDDQCGSGWCLREELTGYPGGFCGQPCQQPIDCPSGYCIPVDESRSTCLTGCATDAECRPEFLCLKLDGVHGGCYPHCTDDAHCPAAGSCNRWWGLCGPETAGGENGAPCLTDADCRGLCSREADSGAPGGICFSLCSADRLTCPGANDTCVVALSPFALLVPMCLPVWQRPAPCREHYAPFLAFDLAHPDPGVAPVCQPACQPGDCPPERPCNPWSGLCGDDPATRADNGEPCVDSSGCKGICFFFFQDGYCTSPCDPSSPLCPGDDVCADLGVSMNCLASCLTDADCRTGYVCNQDIFACVPPPQP